MSNQLYRVGELAKIAGVTVRTLHHYDRIGLLTPTGRTERGYRLYGGADLLRLQQIHIGRSLGLSLEEIRRSLDDPNFDGRAALLRQREALLEKVAEAHAMIASVDAALRAVDHEGEHDMNPKRLFDGFDPAVHEAEVTARWGNSDAYRESSKRTAKYTKEDWTRMRADEDELMARFAAVRAAGTSATEPEAMELAERHRLHIDRWFYPCSTATHAALAQMYLADPRFTAYFDKHGEGLAQFVVEAIEANRDDAS